MPERTKFCFRCGEQGNLGAKFCHGCGSPYASASPPVTQAPPGRKLNTFLLAFCVMAAVLLFGRWALGPKTQYDGADPIGGARLTNSPAPSPTLAPGSRSANGMPSYSQVSDVAIKLGFQLNAFSSNGSSVFLSEAKR